MAGFATREAVLDALDGSQFTFPFYKGSQPPEGAGSVVSLQGSPTNLTPHPLSRGLSISLTARSRNTSCP